MTSATMHSAHASDLRSVRLELKGTSATLVFVVFGLSSYLNFFLYIYFLFCLFGLSSYLNNFYFIFLVLLA